MACQESFLSIKIYWRDLGNNFHFRTTDWLAQTFLRKWKKRTGVLTKLVMPFLWLYTPSTNRHFKKTWKGCGFLLNVFSGSPGNSLKIVCSIIQKLLHAVVILCFNEDWCCVFSSPMIVEVSSCPSPACSLPFHILSPGKLVVHLGIFVTLFCTFRLSICRLGLHSCQDCKM